MQTHKRGFLIRSSCKGGQTFRTRGIKRESVNGGKTCADEILKETKPCNKDICDAPKDCVVGAWEDWTTCSLTCGGGQQYRHRSIETHASFGGKPCVEQLSEVRACSTQPCQEQVDCVWGEWSDFGACSASCGGGVKFRDRSIAVAPRNGGKLCDAKSKTEVVPCNTQACGSGCVDGEWEVWGYW